MHIHVLCNGKEAKYWLEPQVELAKNTGIPEHKLNEIKKIGRTRQTLWGAKQMLTQKLCCQTIHDCQKVSTFAL